MQTIAFGKVSKPYGWLGNMTPYPITYMGNVWRTSEALFQALRTDDYSVRELIRDEKSPMAAKMVAKKHAAARTVAPMSDEDLDIMLKVLRLKLEAHPQLKLDLLATDDAVIVEDCTRRQHGSGLFWGAALQPDGTWQGTNALGVLWMALRQELKGALEKWTQCGQVSPFWVDIGWVRWVGAPEREKLFNIVYRRCKNIPEPPTEANGFIFHLCSEHRK